MQDEVELGQREDQGLADEPAGELRLATGPSPESTAWFRPFGMDLVAAEETLEGFGQRGGRRIPVGGHLFQTLQANPLEVRGDRRADLAGRDRLLLDELSERLGDRRGPEWGPAGQELIQDRTQAIDVGRRADPATDSLLGRHVGWRAHHGTRGRQAAGPIVGPLDQAEVGDVGPARRIDQHVRGFEVAMDQPATMRVVDRLRERNHQGCGAPRVADESAQVPPEVVTLDQLHGVVRVALVAARPRKSGRCADDRAARPLPPRRETGGPPLPRRTARTGSSSAPPSG